ncbi:MAG: hypothetical protein WCW31_02980 [Patescibacteria group bacterium]
MSMTLSSAWANGEWKAEKISIRGLKRFFGLGGWCGAESLPDAIIGVPSSFCGRGTKTRTKYGKKI